MFSSNDSGDDLLGLIILFAIFGRGFGGFGGNGGGSCCQPATCQEVQAGFNNQAVMQQFGQLNNGLNSVAYEHQAQINGLGQTVAGTGYNIMDAIRENGFAQQQGFCGVQRSIDGMNYNMAQLSSNTNNIVSNGFAQSGYNSAMNTNTIVQNGHDDTNRILAKLDAMENARMQERIHSLETENQSLRFQASQSSQNALFQASQDAQTAELLRRTGNDCPVAAYVVQPPTPVTFPNFCQQTCPQTVCFGTNS